MHTAEVFTLLVEDAFYFKLVDFKIVKFHSLFSVLVILISICLLTRAITINQLKCKKLIFNRPNYFISD